MGILPSRQSWPTHRLTIYMRFGCLHIEGIAMAHRQTNHGISSHDLSQILVPVPYTSDCCLLSKFSMAVLWDLYLFIFQRCKHSLDCSGQGIRSFKTEWTPDLLDELFPPMRRSTDSASCSCWLRSTWNLCRERTWGGRQWGGNWKDSFHQASGIRLGNSEKVHYQGVYCDDSITFRLWHFRSSDCLEIYPGICKDILELTKDLDYSCYMAIPYYGSLEITLWRVSPIRHLGL